MLVGIYTELHPQELCLLKTKNANLDKCYIIDEFSKYLF